MHPEVVRQRLDVRRGLCDVARDRQKRDRSTVPGFGHLTHDNDLPSGALHDRDAERVSVPS
jgi:hypothetical protein